MSAPWVGLEAAIAQQPTILPSATNAVTGSVSPEMRQPAADEEAAEKYRKGWGGHASAQQSAVHPDDAAVDAFAAAMKEKLAAARAKGRSGWNGDEPGMQQRLSDMLRAHIEKGDPRDVANFAMFLHQRGEAILPAQGRTA